ncbi:hypothetical protein LEMLEM_LOCUS27637 [Lemmus lemmus]
MLGLLLEREELGQEPTSGGGGGPRTRLPQTRGRVEEEAAEHPPASADFAPSAPGPCGTEKEKPRRAARRGGGGGAGRRRRGRPRLPLCCARPGPRKQKWEEGGALRPAPSAAHGDGAQHIRDPPALAAAARAVRAPAPAAVVTPPRLAVVPARPLAATTAAAAASPAAGDMSNPGGRRNGPVKLRLTGEQGGRLRRRPWPGREPGSRSVVRWRGMRAWEGLVRGGIGEALKRAWGILQNAEWGPWGSRGGRVGDPDVLFPRVTGAASGLLSRWGREGGLPNPVAGCGQ